MDETQIQALDKEGYLLYPALLCAEEIGALRQHLEDLWAAEGEQAGIENYIEKNTRRLANLANKGADFRRLLVHPSVMEAARRVLGPNVRLSMLNARDALPGTGASQPLHSDADHSAKPDAQGYLTCTAIWMLDDFSRQNGATRLVPGTHRSPQLPKEVLPDTLAPHPGEIVIEGKAGDVLVFNGHCWHAGGANHTQQHRRAILVHYIRGDQPQRLNQKEALSPAVQASLAPAERALLGLDS